jgi:hypothetical protein
MGKVTNRTSQSRRNSDFLVNVTTKLHFFCGCLRDALGIQGV